MTFRAKRGIEDFGWGGWDRSGDAVPLAYTIVEGTKRKDFIHTADDGLIAPDGYNNLAVLTSGQELVHGGKGNDIIHGSAGGDLLFGDGGTDILFGDAFAVEHPSDINGLSEEYHSSGGGQLQILSDSQAVFDLTASTLIGLSSVQEARTHDQNIYIETILTRAQISSLRDLQCIDDGRSVNGIFRVSDAGKLDISFVSIRNVDLHGSSGDDDWSISGQIYNDHFHLEAGDDRLVMLADYNYIYADGGDGDDVIISRGLHNDLSGGLGSDRLTGNRKDDSLYGGEGNDVLIGGGDGDRLGGGAGADTFLYTKTSQSRYIRDLYDSIADFSHSDGDKIDLSAIDADTRTPGDQAFHLGGSVFTHVAGEIIQKDVNGFQVLLMDVDGDAHDDMAIQLGTNVTLVTTDFIL